MRPGKLTIATCQHPVGANIKSKLEAIVKLVRSAKSQGADIAHFSECNLTGYAGLDFKEINPHDKPVINERGEIQDRYDKRLLAGTGIEMEHLHYSPGKCSNNYLWISGSNTCKRESCFPAFLVRPDGKVLGKLARNRTGILISKIDMGKSFADPSGQLRDRLKDC